MCRNLGDESWRQSTIGIRFEYTKEMKALNTDIRATVVGIDLSPIQPTWSAKHFLVIQ